jgi:hypothetical protein
VAAGAGAWAGVGAGAGAGDIGSLGLRREGPALFELGTWPGAAGTVAEGRVGGAQGALLLGEAGVGVEALDGVRSTSQLQSFPNGFATFLNSPPRSMPNSWGVCVLHQLQPADAQLAPCLQLMHCHALLGSTDTCTGRYGLQHMCFTT